MILEQAKQKFLELVGKTDFHDIEVHIHCKALTPEEAIGNPLDEDYPIQKGKERIIEADFLGAKGQAFSDAYFDYSGKVRDILALNLDTNARRAIFVASLNAIMARMKLIPPAVHCKDQDLLKCADHFAGFLQKRLPQAEKVLLVGLQPRLLERLAQAKRVRVCDLNPDNIGTEKCGILIDGPDAFAANAQWADTVVSTGSTVVNGTIDDIVRASRDVYFYGVTITGAAKLLGLKQYCLMVDEV